MRQEFIWTAGAAALVLAACNAPPQTPADTGASGTPPQDEAPAPADDTPESAAVEDEAAGLPRTDIALANLEWIDGMPHIAGHRIVTAAGLYDNQPAFDNHGGFYFTTETAGGQTDIHYMNAGGGAHSITNTPDESEYSPRPSPDGRSITYIHQAPGGYGGQVYRQALDGSSTGPVHEYGPAGYYALSGDQSGMLLFALTDPFSLRRIDLVSGTGEDVTTGIGRALYSAPDGQSAYFTLQHPEGGFAVNRFGFSDSAITPVFRLPGETEDYAVFTNPDGELAWLAVSDGTLFYRASHDSWQAVGDLAAAGLTGISRLAVSPDAGQLAIVVEE